MKLAVLDIGGTQIKYSVMDESLLRTYTGAVDTPMDSQESFLKCVKEIYDSISDGTEGLAISMPGMIDADSGYCYTGGMLSYNQDKPVAKQISELCGCPVFIDNDGKCAAYAEYTVGSLQGCSNAAVFLIGTGVGGGLIINGQLLRGKHCSAGEFSFLSRSLGEWGTLEGLVGHSDATTGLLERLRIAKGLKEDEPLNGKIAFGWINSGDEIANCVFNEFTYGIAHEIYNLQMLLDIEKIAIGGGISREDRLIQGIRDSFTKLLADAFPGMHGLVRQTVEIVPCQYGNEANQIGAYQGFCSWWKEKNL